MYQVAMTNRLRYTLVAVLFTAAMGSVLLVARQRSFHWYTWAAFVVFLIGTTPLLWEKVEKDPSYGWFYNWLASARRRPGLRYASIAIWILILIQQVAIAMKHGHMNYFTWFVVCAAPVVLFRFTWPLPKPSTKTN
jgi:hypothetical protein